MAQKKNETKEEEAKTNDEAVSGSTDQENPAPTSAKNTSTIDKKSKYQLADPNTAYSENNFTLAGKEQKELPEDPSSQLIQRIRHGFIVEVEK